MNIKQTKSKTKKSASKSMTSWAIWNEQSVPDLFLSRSAARLLNNRLGKNLKGKVCKIFIKIIQ